MARKGWPREAGLVEFPDAAPAWAGPQGLKVICSSHQGVCERLFSLYHQGVTLPSEPLAQAVPASPPPTAQAAPHRPTASEKALWQTEAGSG